MVRSSSSGAPSASPATPVATAGEVQPEGRQIAITATTAPGQLIWRAPIEGFDRITVEAVNIDTVAHQLVLLWGGQENADKIPIDIEPAGYGVQVVIEDRLLLKGFAINAYADLASMVNVYVRAERSAP